MMAAMGLSIYETMSQAAREHGAINLGQAMPDMMSPPAAIEAAQRAIQTGANSYAASAGLPELRAQIASFGALAGMYDATSETTVFAGSTEALAAALLAFAGPGTEVLVFEPCYDDYPLQVHMAGDRLIRVPLKDVGGRFHLEPKELQRRVSSASRILILNTPHNPSGTVFRKDELAAIAKVAIASNLLVIADEVYEHYTYDAPHVSIASFPEMRERTVVISSASKTFGLPGWRVGWAMAEASLTDRIRSVHRSLSFCAPTPLQWGIAEGLRSVRASTYVEDLRNAFRARRDTLCAGLFDAGFEPIVPEGAFFVLARTDRWSPTDAVSFCLDLARRARVSPLPMPSFFANAEDGRRYIRFAFCRGVAELRIAADRLRAYAVTA